MNLFEIIGIAIGLAMDAFAVALATSVRLGIPNAHQIFRFSFHFGLFQAMMPVIGWYLGSFFQHFIADYDHWVAFALLSFIGGKALLEINGKKGKGKKDRKDSIGIESNGSLEVLDDSPTASSQDKLAFEPGQPPQPLTHIAHKTDTTNTSSLDTTYDRKADPTKGSSLVILSIATSIDALAVGLSLAMLGVSIWLPVAIIGIITAGLTLCGMLIGARLGLKFGRTMEIVGGLVLIGIGIKIVVEHLGG